MLKLVYDLKVGFDDCYLTVKNEEYEISCVLEMGKLGTVEYLEEIEATDGEPLDLDALLAEDEESFYQEYANDIEGLLDFLDNGTLEMLESDSRLYFSKLYFSHLLGGTPIKYVVPVWEPSNWRLEYDPTTRSSYYYEDACSAKEVCDLLKLTRQQLHYYVKTGAIRKEFNPDNNKQFKYNRLDVQVLQKKLEKKYERFKEN